MRHVFVETNWVWGYIAPAHHKDLEAVNLLRRAGAGEIQMHLPAPCLGEGRQSVRTKCQPRREADAVREFLTRAKAEQAIPLEHERIARELLDRFEVQVRAELAQVESVLASLLQAPGLEVFPLNQNMLDRLVGLSTADLDLKPFDQAVLAAVLVRAEELWSAGERDLSFCEKDSDLQPWGRHDNAKEPLTSLHDRAGVWVYGDFDLRAPERPTDWP